MRSMQCVQCTKCYDVYIVNSEYIVNDALTAHNVHSSLYIVHNVRIVYKAHKVCLVYIAQTVYAAYSVYNVHIVPSAFNSLSMHLPSAFHSSVRTRRSIHVPFGFHSYSIQGAFPFDAPILDATVQCETMIRQ